MIYNEFMVIPIVIIAILIILALISIAKEPTKEEIREVNDKHSKDTF